MAIDQTVSNEVVKVDYTKDRDHADTSAVLSADEHRRYVKIQLEDCCRNRRNNRQKQKMKNYRQTIIEYISRDKDLFNTRQMNATTAKRQFI